KGTVQEIIPMDYGQVKLTRSKFYRISGESTQHRGVIPDISFPDYYDAYENIGESSLDGALPWDTVRAVEYSPYHAIQALLPELQQRYDERAKASPDFIYLRDQIERTRVMRQREQLSLNEQTVKKEREESRRTEFDAENMRRLLKGLTLNEWIEDLNAEEEEDEELVANNDTDTSDEPEEEAVEDEGDPLLLESGRILADFIALNSNRVSSVSPENTRLNR
ncbi:MAG: carboxy terminal-processing peptidase, partial [Gammaproteobacteria bacterium]|nr:carboxy terminal-processing peptidase [Gammaproteobacteria bacterium]